jgi:hypothetical protein
MAASLSHFNHNTSVLNSEMLSASFSFGHALTVSTQFRRASYCCWAAISLAVWILVVLCFDLIASSSISDPNLQVPREQIYLEESFL